jgi:hypothetical protein
MFDERAYEDAKVKLNSTSDLVYRSDLWQLAFRQKVLANPTVPLTLEEVLGALESVYCCGDERSLNIGDVKEVLAIVLPYLENPPAEAARFLGEEELLVFEHLFAMGLYAEKALPVPLRLALARVLEMSCPEAPELDNEAGWTEQKTLGQASKREAYLASGRGGRLWPPFLIRDLRANTTDTDGGGPGKRG